MPKMFFGILVRLPCLAPTVLRAAFTGMDFSYGFSEAVKDMLASEGIKSVHAINHNRRHSRQSCQTIVRTVMILCGPFDDHAMCEQAGISVIVLRLSQLKIVRVHGVRWTLVKCLCDAYLCLPLRWAPLYP